MAVEEHLRRVKGRAHRWNKWLAGQRRNFAADLQKADLRGLRGNRINLERALLLGADLEGASLHNANLAEAYMQKAKLEYTDLGRCDLFSADLSGTAAKGANFKEANLGSANLSRLKANNAIFSGANFRNANLEYSDLSGADLSFANLVSVNLKDALLNGCRVYGAAVWDVKLQGAQQKGLVITPPKRPEITVDSLEVAQFLYMVLNNAKLNKAIESISTKIVLILGRFSTERKIILDAVRDRLPHYNYVPVIFDFERPYTHDFIEPVVMLAMMSSFVIADFTDAKIILEEAPRIVTSSAVPFMPIIQEDKGTLPTTVRNLQVNHRSVGRSFVYKDQSHLLAALETDIIGPARQIGKDMLQRRRDLTI